MIEHRLKSANDLSQDEEQKLFLTAEEMRSFPKYANASDDEVWDAINTFHSLAIICYDAFVKEENKQASQVKI
jgi:hypothetical protein